MIEMVVILGLLLIVGGGSKPKTKTAATPDATPGAQPTVSMTTPPALTIPKSENPATSSDPFKLGSLVLDSGTNGGLDSGGGISTGTAAAAPQPGGDSSDSGSVASVLQ